MADFLRHVKVKVCGITRPEDAMAAEELGVDAIGMIFAASKRRVDEAAASEVAGSVGPFVVKVGVFRDQPLDEVLRVSSRLRLDVVQLHGREDAGFAAAVRQEVPVVRAVSAEEAPTPTALAGYPADAFLLDAREPGAGQAFDWSIAAAWRGHPRLVVAGGLTPRNVADAIRALAPYAVDVSSGVESSPGVKDRRLMAEFVMAARSVVIHSPTNG
jgi:phosphoribosylanthranilate isomerase